MGFLFVVQSAALGVGLAMDAFSVSMANGLACPHMSRGSMGKIAGTFAFFQFLMPMLGWLAVHMLVQYFEAFEKAIPWITLFLLGYIGIKMIWEGIHRQEDQEAEEPSLRKRGSSDTGDLFNHYGIDSCAGRAISTRSGKYSRSRFALWAVKMTALPDRIFEI